MFLALKSAINLIKIAFFLLASILTYPFVGNQALYFFLRHSGPSFVKLGQLLSTRADLIGENLAQILSSFQDNLTPFSAKQAQKIVAAQLGKKITALFLEFSPSPVASASVAQVHKAKTLAGEAVAVKILRPNIAQLMRRDIYSLRQLSWLVGIFSPYIGDKLSAIMLLLEASASKELDLLMEGAASSNLKEKLKDVQGFYIPKIYWPLSTSKVLVMEWIEGIAFSNRELIAKAHFNKKQIAQNLVISYFNQVYVHGFFHADMHPGNLFLMANGDIGLVDFGIIGIIDKKTRLAVAEILMAFLQRDYERVAKLHVDNGLVPIDTDLGEFALTCRMIGESMVDLSVKQVSLAKLLGQLIKMTRKYNMVTKPDLLLLQKTMMLLEGVGVTLNQDLNIWELARPWMKQWAIKNIGFDAKIRDHLLNIYEHLKVPPLQEKSQASASQELILKITRQTKIWKVIALLTSSILIIFCLK